MWEAVTVVEGIP